MTDTDLKALGKDPLAWVFEEDRDEPNTANHPPQDAVRITLAAVQDITRVTELATTLQNSFGQPCIEIDATAVQRVDTATLQLLYAFRNELHKRDHVMRWLSPSPDLHRAAHQLGLHTALALPN